ncbi:Ribonuclease h domain, partial [Thalictrum thalictroides]
MGEVEPLAIAVEKTQNDTIQVLEKGREDTPVLVENENEGIDLAVVLNTPLELQGLPPDPDKASKPMNETLTHKLIDEVAEAALKLATFDGGTSTKVVAQSAKKKIPVDAPLTRSKVGDVNGVMLTFVHGHTYYVKRRELWSQFSPVSKPWLVLGDFNSYLSIDEKRGVRKPIVAGMEDFRSFLNDNLLLEVPNKGIKYTWCNQRHGSRRVLGKIDRMCCNEEWLQQFPGWSYKILSRLCSDHAPLIGWTVVVPKPANCPFKFLNMWAAHPSFLDMVANSWFEPLEARHNPLLNLSLKLKRLKRAIKHWNKYDFGHLGTRITEETEILQHFQILADSNPDEEVVIKQAEKQEKVVEELLDQECTLLKQKAGIKWAHEVKEGGMGLRRLADVNKACLMKMAWSVQQENGDWLKFIKGKYTARSGDWCDHKTSSVWPGLKQ